MKRLLSIFTILICLNLFSQNDKMENINQKEVIDIRTQLEKEDSVNLYNQEEVTNLDLIEALEFASIRIHKFKIGEFDKKYKLQIFADEYVNGKLIKTDTLLDYNNEYVFFPTKEAYKKAYIDQIKILSKTVDNKSVLKFNLYSMSTQKEINLSKSSTQQFYNLREFNNVSWKLNNKIPLMIFASSWYDKRINSHRFCGVVKLNEEEDATKELLSNSPNYIIVNYKISKI